MPKFKQGDKVVVSSKCEELNYRGISGKVLEVRAYYSDGLINRVSLDNTVNNACIFWFADHELEDANVLTDMVGELVRESSN